jgi:hypothetical protein
MFQPLVIANRYGQFGSFLLLGMVLVFIGLRDRRTLPFVAGALIVFVKPQLFLAFAPVVVVLLIRARAWRTIGITATTLLAIAAIMTIRYPESLAIFRRGATDRADAFAQYSTTWSVAHLLAPALWVAVAIALVAVAVVATVAAIRRLPLDLRLAGTVAGAALLSVAVAPVAFHYDQVVLVPAVVLAVALGRRPLQIMATWAVAGIAPWLIFLIELGLGEPETRSVWSGVVPLLLASLLWLATRSASSRTVAIATLPANAK